MLSKWQNAMKHRKTEVLIDIYHFLIPKHMLCSSDVITAKTNANFFKENDVMYLCYILFTFYCSKYIYIYIYIYIY